MSVTELAQDVVEFIDQQDLDIVNILGHRFLQNQTLLAIMISQMYNILK